MAAIIPLMQRESRSPATYLEGIQWLRDHADELREAPTRLHDHAIGEGGGPRYAAAFWALLMGSPYATVSVDETRDCPIGHRYSEPCQLCDGNLSYVVARTLYRHPLAAALERLKHAPATSHDWPKPYELVVLLLRSDFHLPVAAAAIGHPILDDDHRKTVEAAFLLAIRKLAGRWSSGPIPRAPKWTELSESHQAAILGGEAAA